MSSEIISPSLASSLDLEARSCMTVDQWKQVAQEKVGKTNCVLQRNYQITASYAQTYLKHPKLYKWAAMAAFASHHVRLALKPFALARNRDILSEGGKGLKNTRIIKEINDAIYDDIYWAHLAYDGSSEGLQRVIQAAGDNPVYSSLVSGFRKLEQARLQLEEEPNSAEAESLIWEANTELLQHEQNSMVQPRFEKLASGFSRSLSLFATMHYQFGGRCKSALLPGAFLAFMLLWRKNKTKLGGFPDIANFQHRWEWINDGILPGFRCYENRNAIITRDLQKLIARSKTIHT